MKITVVFFNNINIKLEVERDEDRRDKRVMKPGKYLDKLSAIKQLSIMPLYRIRYYRHCSYQIKMHQTRIYRRLVL